MIRSILVVIFMSGCLGKPVSPKLAVESKESSLPVVHIVKSSKESLADLAKWYTGDALNVVAIAKYNGKKNIAKLQIGESILIPEFLVKTRKAFVPKESNAKQNKNNSSLNKEKDTEVKSTESKRKRDLLEEELDSIDSQPSSRPRATENERKSDVLNDSVQPKPNLEKDERKLDELRYKYLQELNDR